MGGTNDTCSYHQFNHATFHHFYIIYPSLLNAGYTNSLLFHHQIFQHSFHLNLPTPMPRQVRSQKPPTVSEALRLLRDCAKKLRVLKVLTKTQARNVRDRVNILNDIQTTPKRNKYKLFLYDLLCDAGPALVLLCVMSLGQGKVTSMNKDAREELRRQIKDRLPEFNDPILQSLASTHGVPDPPEAQNVTHKQMVPESKTRSSKSRETK